MFDEHFDDGSGDGGDNHGPTHEGVQQVAQQMVDAALLVSVCAQTCTSCVLRLMPLLALDKIVSRIDNEDEAKAFIESELNHLRKGLLKLRDAHEKDNDTS